MKKIRIVINNEAYIDMPVPPALEMSTLAVSIQAAKGLIMPEVFVPYEQIQAIFMYVDDIASTINVTGMTKQ
jgi:hypothetical protein